MIIYKDNSILNCDEQYLIHQCNCTSKHSKGLAKLIFDKYSNSNTYINLNYKRQQGTISYHINSNLNKIIINMYAQLYPGKSNLTNDTKENRIYWFKCCLNVISKIGTITSIAVPYKIGCGLAGGDWNEYINILEQFSKENNINIIIYKP